MSNDIRTIGKQTLIYGAGIVVGRLAGFLMLPIYTRFLTLSDYGILELLTTTVDFVGTIAAMGVAGAVFKFYVDEETEAGKHTVVSTAAIGLVTTTLVACSLGEAFSPFLSTTVLGQDGHALYFQLFFATHVFQTAENIPLLYLRARGRAVAFVAISVLRLLLALALNIYFVVVLRLGVVGVLYSSLIVSAVAATGLSAWLIRETGLRFDFGRFRRMLRFGAPMVLWSLGSFVVVFSDRYFLKHFAGTGTVGIYSLAYRFALLITALGFRPFSLVWGPQRFEIAKRHNGVATIRRVFGYVNLLLGFVALMIALFADEVIRVMAAPSFHPAAALVPTLLGAQILLHLVAFPNLSMLVTERTRVLAGLAAAAAVVVLVFNLVLIPRFGAWGAALATLGGYAVRFGLVYIVAQRIRPFEYAWPRVARVYLFFGGVLSAHAWLSPSGLPGSIAVSVTLALGCWLVVYLRVLNAGERAFIRETAARPFVRHRRIRREAA